MRIFTTIFLLGALVLGGVQPAQATVIEDDFEIYTTGTFPASWQDVGDVDPSSTAPTPSAMVVETTDAFGAPTKALQINDAIAPSQGIYQSISPTSKVTISTDVRIDQFSNNSSNPILDGPIGIGLAQAQGTTDLVFAPGFAIFASSLTKTWHSYAYGSDGTFSTVDLLAPALLDTWYRVDLSLDTLNGSMTSMITDIALNTTLLNQTITVPGWTPQTFDTVLFGDSELTPETTRGNITTIDNITVSTIPVPTTLALFSLGFAGLGFAKRKKA